MYYLTTTIDELSMADLINDTALRINANMRKCQPFGIVRTEEPLDPINMPWVDVSTFYLVLTGEAAAKNAKQEANFMAAMMEAAEEVRRLNEGNYIVARPHKPGQKAK